LVDINKGFLKFGKRIPLRRIIRVIVKVADKKVPVLPIGIFQFHNHPLSIEYRSTLRFASITNSLKQCGFSHRFVSHPALLSAPELYRQDGSATSRIEETRNAYELQFWYPVPIFQQKEF
jgi:hypothetical protein